MSTLRKSFGVLAVTCGAAWLLKMVFIAAAGGADADGGLLIGVAWAVGMLTFLLSAGIGAALIAHGAQAWLRVVVGVAAVPLAFLAINLLDAGINAVNLSAGWLWDEMSLVVSAVAMATAGALALRGRERPRPADLSHR